MFYLVLIAQSIQLDPSQIIYKFTPAATSKYESLSSPIMRILDLVPTRQLDHGEELISASSHNVTVGLPATFVSLCLSLNGGV